MSLEDDLAAGVSAAMRRRLMDGLPKTGVTLTLAKYASHDCSDDIHNTLEFTHIPVRSGGGYPCVTGVDEGSGDGTGGTGFIDDVHCDMATIEYRGTVYPQSSWSCYGVHSTFAYPANGTCVTAADGTSLRAMCEYAEREVVQQETSHFVAFAIFTAVIVSIAACCVAVVVWRSTRREVARSAGLPITAEVVPPVKPITHQLPVFSEIQVD